MRPLALPLVLLVAISVQVSAQDTLSDATEAWRRGDLPRAARLFAAAAEAETDPVRRADIRTKLAWTYFVMQHRDRAEEALAAALDDQPQLELVPDYYTQEFLELFARVRQRRAQPAGGQAASGGPVAGPSLATLRQKLAQAIDFAAVDSILVAVQRLEAGVPASQLPEVLELKVEALERLGRTEDALEQRGRLAALRAVAQAPAGTNPWPLDTLLEARRLLANGLAAESAAMMRGVLREIPSCGPALEVLGEALLAAGRLEEASGALQTALFNNQSPELMMALGEVELRRGRTTNARDLFRRAASSDDGNDRAWASLGLLAAQMADRDTAREALDRALEANGTLFEARVVRAQLALAVGDAAAAVQDLLRALQIRPDDPWASGWLGVAHLALGRTDAAAPLLRHGHDADPAAFTLPLAELLRRQGDAAAALELLPAVGTDDAASADLLRVRCLLDLGRIAEARTVLEGLTPSASTDARAAYLAAAVAYAEREWPAAVSALEHAEGSLEPGERVARALQRARAAAAAQVLMDGALTVPRPTPAR